MKNLWIGVLLPALLIFGSCKKEILNPNAATLEEVVQSVDGLLGLVVGIKKEYSVGATSALYNMVSANGLTTKELYVINTGNGDLSALETGKATLGNGNAISANVFSSSNFTNAYSKLLIDNASNIPDADVAAYVRGYGYFFRALSLGTQAQFWEQAPLNTVASTDFLGGGRATFSTRAEVLAEALRALDAISLPATVPSAVASKVGNDIDLLNAVKALRARYKLMAGDYAGALAAANSVDLTKKSVWKFETLNPNPVYRTSLVNNNTYNGVYNFGLTGTLAPDPADGRIAFYLAANPTSQVKVAGFFKSDTDVIPLYLPGEMMLIKAEAEARADRLTEAVGHLDAVLQKTGDIFGVNAGLPAYTGAMTKEAILEAIYQNRCIELYMSGLKLEDSRRFGRPGPNDTNAERNRNFYPYPLRERSNNPNTPADPTI